MHVHNFAAICLLVGQSLSLAVAARSSAEPTEGSRYHSPKNAIFAYRDAVTREDWRAAFNCYTPKMQEKEIVEVLFRMAVMPSNELELLAKKYGVIYGNCAGASGKTSRSSEVAWKALLAGIEDKASLYADFMTWAARSGPAVASIEKVERISVHGQWAECLVVAIPTFRQDRMSAGKIQRMIYLRQIGNTWLLAAPSEWRSENETSDDARDLLSSEHFGEGEARRPANWLRRFLGGKRICLIRRSRRNAGFAAKSRHRPN